MASKQPAIPASAKGRKALATIEPAAPALDDTALAARNGELQQLAKAESALRKLADNIGYAGALDADSLWSMVEYRQRRSVEDIMEMGRGLVLLKEQTPHGNFRQQCDGRGIHYRTAARLMGVALKFSKIDTKSLLAAAGTQAKVLELAVLEDEELAALESGESVAGIKMDDVERMSASQLRAALRDAREELSVKDERQRKLSEKLDRADEQTTRAQRKWKAATPDEQQITLEQRVVSARLEIIANIGAEKSGLVAALIELADHCNKHGLDCSQFMGDTLDALIAAVRRVRDDYNFGFAVDLAIDARA